MPHPHTIPRRVLLGLALGTTMLCLPAIAQQSFDITSAQKDQPRAEVVPEAVALLKGTKLARPGTFTIATTGQRLPFGINATDNQKIIVGSEPDIGRLVADSLGLELEVVQVAWADWPLGVISGKYDAAIANITVTEQRKERFDFSTYRKDQIGFYVGSKSAIRDISKSEDVAGLKVIVSSGTNQEQILLRWIKANEAKGLKTTEIQYYDDDVVLYLALESGRADAYFGPNGTLGFKAAQTGNSRLVGSFSGGWPEVAEIAVTTKKGAGLADAITAALNAQIKNGNYQKSLARWGLGSEAIDVSRTNPPGLPKS
jgi:polar amino acid transport system substrate-binding protein